MLNKEMSKVTKRNDVHHLSDANLRSAAVYSCRAPCTPRWLQDANARGPRAPARYSFLSRLYFRPSVV